MALCVGVPYPIDWYNLCKQPAGPRGLLYFYLWGRTRNAGYPVPEASSLCKKLVVEELLGRVPGLGPRGHAIVQEALEGLVEKRRYLSE